MTLRISSCLFHHPFFFFFFFSFILFGLFRSHRQAYMLYNDEEDGRHFHFPCCRCVFGYHEPGQAGRGRIF